MKTTIPYAAGYIDGDGCLYLGKTIQKPKNIIVYEYSIQIVSVKRKSLEFLSNAFGGYIRKKPQRERRKLPYCWTIKTINALNFAKMIYPFLTDKRRSCEYFIKFASSITPNAGKITPNETINFRNNLISKIRKEKHMIDWVTKEKVDSLKQIGQYIEPTEEDYAYLAGLIDSEGCFRIKKWKPKDKPNYVYAINLEIGNKRFPIFPWLTERFGGNTGFYYSKNIIKPMAIWTISARSLANIIHKVYPFLICKKDVSKKIIEFIDTILPNGGDRNSDAFKKRYTEVLSIRETIVNEIHNLNLKGVKLPEF